ncbi:MAG: hypothetical protein HY873_10070, partial [Chloroflexi bacterium]|nr:hypothetical protein [Chloroflexota bacterium]
MAHTARTVLPTDLVALVSYDGKVYANEAMTRDRIGTQDSPHPLETALEQWFSFATGRHTCVSVKGATLRGLVSARKRATKQAWEIDCLIDAAQGDNSVLMSLLDRMTEAAGRSGAMRLFLRLPAGSDTEVASTRCAFAPYVRERVYRRDVDKDAHRKAPDVLRRRTKDDSYAVFQLYNELVPPEVRRFEGMTFGEWTAAQESLGRATQYVVDDGGRVRGWLRVAGEGDIGRFDVLGSREVLDSLLEAALTKVANRERAV